MTDNLVYIKGNSIRGREIIEHLKRLGGKNPLMHMGNSTNSYYFIDNIGCISMTNNPSILYNYKEITLDDIDKSINKVFIKGDRKRYNEIRDLLIEYGAVNKSEYGFYDDQTLYAISSFDGTSIVSYDISQRSVLLDSGYDEIYLDDKTDFDHFEKVIVLTKSNKWKLDFYSHKDKKGRHVCISYQYPKRVIEYNKNNIKLLD